MPKFHLQLRDKIIVISLLLLTVLIPTGTYVLSLRYKTQSRAQEYNAPVTSPKEEATASSKLKEALDRFGNPAKDSGTGGGEVSSEQTTTETGTNSPGTSSLILGPTLGFSLILQGRPLDNQSTQAFLGIASGQPQNKPNYLLSFMVNVPASGAFDGVSLSGLDTGSTYTAYLKGEGQIATASAFVVKATPVNLGALNLLTGDVNEDNVIDILDYNLVKAAIGLTPSSNLWNPLYDFNLDNIVNSWDLNIILSNLAKIGASGAWYSYTPVATASATLSNNQTNTGGPDSKNGYWLWVP